MTSSPKRLKIPSPLSLTPPDLLLHPSHQKKLLTPSKLPVRNGSSIRTATTATGSPYAQSPRVKGALGLPRRSPYGERSAPSKMKVSDMGGVKLNFGPLRGDGGRGGGGGGGGNRFRRVGGPRLSQSPARRSTFFNDPNLGGAVPKMGFPRGVSDSPPESTKGSGSSLSPEQAHVAEKTGVVGRQTVPPPTKTPLPKTAEEKEAELIDAGNEALRKLLQARANTLRMEVDSLMEEVSKEEARAEQNARAAHGKLGEDDVEVLVKRLLSANDSSHLSLPTLRSTSPGVPSAKPLPLSNPDLQLSVFHCLTFTSTTTTTVTSSNSLDSLDSSDHPPITQRHSASGFAANRLLYFNLTFDVSAPSWCVTRTTYTISPWARRELQHSLNCAAEQCDINTLLYAFSSYTTLARKRATVFAALGKSFPKLLPVLAPRGAAGRREMVPLLGAALLRFRERNTAAGPATGLELVVSWNIGLGVGGEAESCIEADVRIPEYWTDADELRSFTRIGDVFRGLVEERGVLEATRCVVGLVFQ